MEDSEFISVALDYYLGTPTLLDCQAVLVHLPPMKSVQARIFASISAAFH